MNSTIVFFLPLCNLQHQVGEQGCVILRDHARFVCHGDLTGRIVLHDPRTMRQEHYFQAHTGSLSDFDVLGNYIATCGFSNRLASWSVGVSFLSLLSLFFFFYCFAFHKILISYV